MPYKVDKVALGDAFLKRSAKLIPCQKEMVHYHYNRLGLSIGQIARDFKVSKRTVQFILFPERQQRNVELRKLRGGSAIYYDKEANRLNMKDHRDYKKDLIGHTVNTKKKNNGKA